MESNGEQANEETEPNFGDAWAEEKEEFSGGAVAPSLVLTAATATTEVRWRVGPCGSCQPLRSGELDGQWDYLESEESATGLETGDCGLEARRCQIGEKVGETWEKLCA